MAAGSVSGGVSSFKDTSNDLSSRGNDTDPSHHHLTSAKHFMEWIYKVEAQLDRKGDCAIKKCCESLKKNLNDIQRLLDRVSRTIHFLAKFDLNQVKNLQVNAGLSTVDELSIQYEFVSNKSNSLHTACQNVMTEWNDLSKYLEDVSNRLNYHLQAEGMVEMLGLPTYSVHTEHFASTLDKIDNCVTFLQRKPNYANSNVYIVKYKAALARALGMIKDYVRNSFTQAAASTSSDSLLTSEDTFALLYGKFRAQVPKVESVVGLMESRIVEGKKPALFDEYQSALQDCQGFYFDCRAQLLVPSVKATVSKLHQENRHNHCGLMRSGCSMLLHISDDEYRLYKQFFNHDSELFKAFLDGICVLFYDTMRPLIVNLQHLETLSELTSIMRTEMLEYHCVNHPVHLQAFEQVVGQLLQDVQERLIFRSHIYIRTDIAGYNPHPGDLSYPEKLEMMESIQDSLKEASEKNARRNSVSSNTSLSSMEVANINNKLNSSPVDMHGMWYPTVRRTLVCLSRLYRCLELEIFQGLSQEVLGACTFSLQNASQLITDQKGVVNGQLFLIKHLLILREQMTPFQVQLAVTEHSLDFTKLKTAALNLISQRGASNLIHGDNAIIKYLLEGTVPDVKEHCIDSRREIDQGLKRACEKFIAKSVDSMVGPMRALLEKVSLIELKRKFPDR